MDAQDLELRIAHDAWANQRLIEKLESAPGGDPTPVRLLAHVAATHLLWQDRILGRASRIAVHPEGELAAIAALGAEATAIWRDLASRLVAEEDRVVSYVNSKGVPYQNRVADIVTHAFLHAQYHRGQINAWLRRAGHEPVLVDYIAFRR
ncbi:MAG: DinB family protein [Candidatus Eisenbacteria bacterium]